MATHTIPTLPAEMRDRTGTRYAARLRKAGRLPAVIYGHGGDVKHVSVDDKACNDLILHGARVIQFDVDGTVEPCLLKEVQWDHLVDSIIHMDLARIDLSEKVTVEIELDFHGECKALEEDGALMINPTHTVEVECLATDIPDNIRVDIAPMTLETAITVADLVAPEGVTILTDPTTVVASITIQAEVEEEEVETADADAEPEVIGAEDKQDDDSDDE